MLSLKLAERFVKQISTYTLYNVNIMDEKGIIIASRDSSRIGQFHETAYEMLRTQKEIGIISDDSGYLGVKRGVNLLINDGTAFVGVVGVTGPPEKVQETALIIKMSLETMIRYEIQLESSFNARNTYERLYLSLFLDKSSDRASLEDQARQLQLSPRLMRIPVLFKFAGADDVTEPFLYLRRTRAPQDIYWLHDTCYILCYHAIEEAGALSLWRSSVTEWLKDLSERIPYTQVYVGAPQNRLHLYHTGLKHCLWLEKNCSASPSPLFFFDHMSQYTASLIPVPELHGIFNAYTRSLSQAEKQSIIQTVEALRQSNYNLVTASKLLFIHKNTLAFRINKLRSALNIDPLHVYADRIFLEYLSTCLSREQNSL